jgi:hypothetical protein
MLFLLFKGYYDNNSKKLRVLSYLILIEKSSIPVLFAKFVLFSVVFLSNEVNANITKI